MKLQEAIEIKTYFEPSPSKAPIADWIIADRISIEAMKRCKYLRDHTDRWANVLLPGETED